MKTIEDYDLDVINLLKDFPSNEEDSFLYIRGKIDPKKANIAPSFVHTMATFETLATMIYSFIELNENARNAVFNAVLFYLNQKSKKERKLFISHLTQEKE